MTTDNGPDRSVGGETGQVGDVAVGARVQRAKEKVVQKAKEKAVQIPSSTDKNGHQGGCGRLYKKPACNR